MNDIKTLKKIKAVILLGTAKGKFNKIKYRDQKEKKLYKPAVSLRILDDEFGWFRDAKARRSRTLLAIKLYLKKVTIKSMF